MDRPSAIHKAVLASLIVASIVIPLRAARTKNLRAGVTEALVAFGVFALMYLLLALFTAPGT